MFVHITLCKTDVRTKPEIFSGDFEKRKSAELFRTFSTRISHLARPSILRGTLGNGFTIAHCPGHTNRQYSGGELICPQMTSGAWTLFPTDITLSL